MQRLPGEWDAYDVSTSREEEADGKLYDEGHTVDLALRSQNSHNFNSEGFITTVRNEWMGERQRDPFQVKSEKVLPFKPRGIRR